MAVVKGPTLGLGIDAGEAKRGAREWDRATDRVSRDAVETSKKVDGLNRSLRGFGVGLGRASGAINALESFTIAAGVTTLAAAFSKVVSEADEFARSTAQLNKLIETTGGAAGRTVADIEALSREIGRVTLASADDVRAAAAQLLTFRSISGQVFDETLRLAQDLASLGFGSIQSATVQLAKALDDPIRGLTALRRSGISFTKDQQELIKSLVETGQALQAQQLIIEAVASQVAGAGAAAAEGTLAGAWDTFLEELDRFVDTSPTVAGGLDLITDAVNGLAESVEILNRDRMAELEAQIARFEKFGADPMVKLLEWITGSAADARRELEMLQRQMGMEAEAEAMAAAAASTRGAPLPSIGEGGFRGSPEVGPAGLSATVSRLESRFAREQAAESSKRVAGAARDTERAIESAVAEAMAADTVLEEVERDFMAAHKLFLDTRTESEMLAIEIAELDRLFESGALDAETYARAIAQVGEESDRTANTMMTTFRSAADIVVGAFASMATGAEVSVESIGRSLLQLFAGRAINAGLDSLFSLISGGISGAAGSGGLFSSLFGGGGGAAPFAPGVGPGGMGFLHFGGPRADGGPVLPGTAYPVGERGPEMFVPSAAGTIVPNHALGSTIVINQTLNGDYSESMRRQIRMETPRIVQAAIEATTERNSRSPGMFRR